MSAGVSGDRCQCLVKNERSIKQPFKAFPVEPPLSAQVKWSGTRAMRAQLEAEAHACEYVHENDATITSFGLVAAS